MCYTVGAYSKWLDASSSGQSILPSVIDILMSGMGTSEDSAAAAALAFRHICAGTKYLFKIFFFLVIYSSRWGKLRSVWLQVWNTNNPCKTSFIYSRCVKKILVDCFTFFQQSAHLIEDFEFWNRLKACSGFRNTIQCGCHSHIIKYMIQRLKDSFYYASMWWWWWGPVITTFNDFLLFLASKNALRFA